MDESPSRNRDLALLGLRIGLGCYSFLPVGAKCHMSRVSLAFGNGCTCHFHTSLDPFMPLLSSGAASC